MKVRTGLGAEAALPSALGLMIRSLARLVIIWRGLIAAEAALAMALLVLPPRSGGIAVAVFFVAAAGYAAVAMRVAPDRSCGCFGAGGEPASRFTIARALLLAAAAGAYAATDPSPLQAMSSPRAWIGLLALGCLTLLLSPELRAPLHRRAAARRFRNCSRTAVDTHAVVALIHRTNAWRAMNRYVVRHDPSDAWREGCWQFFTFDAAADGNVATVVFAIGIPPARTSCRAMLRRGFTGPPIFETPEEPLRWPRKERAPGFRRIVHRRNTAASDFRPAA
jgi:hypothetical protein